MLPLQLIITQSGLDALVNAQDGGTDAIQVAEIGLTQTGFTPAPTIDTLPGEFKRLDTVSGQSVSDTVIHMTAVDADEVAYDLRGFGLYLSDGTLFAVYGQDDPLFRKVAATTFLFVQDIAFGSPVAGSIVFGDALFVNPPATETVKGVAEIATDGEAQDGLDDQRIITPLKLKSLLDAIRTLISTLQGHSITGSGLVTGGGDLSDDRVLTVLAASAADVAAAMVNDRAVTPLAMAAVTALLGRTITGAGLVTGGGDLGENRTLTVPAALASDVAAGTATDRAITPAALSGLARSLLQNGYAVLPGTGGLILQWGRFTAISNGTSSVLFPLTFPFACFSAVPAGGVSGGADSQDNPPVLVEGSITANGFSVYSADESSAGQSYLAVGI